ncbi:glycosyltransferase family 4 protein [Aurantimonas sp. A2-1-M11]|uniref:glycosyltransferase family 4 protein n=1 Tax=Aurantimonas sp. A2-1-M11 TaxID=3113712 RepID=UPI002F942009
MSRSSPTQFTIWGHSYCRSTAATYLALKDIYPAEIDVVICGAADPGLRLHAGFRSDEFPQESFLAVAPSMEDALRILTERARGIHMFCAYHGNPLYKRLLDTALALNVEYVIASEAPENMEKNVFGRVAKEAFIRTYLRYKVEKYIKGSRFIVSFSGDSTDRLRQVGWPLSKIEKFGYYPPPLISARPEMVLPQRPAPCRPGPLIFLLSGTHCRHKSPATLVDAAEHLVRWGLGDQFRCIVTGAGLQTRQMENKSSALYLPIEFRGFVQLNELITLYRTSDLFVATGTNEPWGIRVNDAMQLGCPSIVSSGMGAAALVKEDQNGWIYRSSSSLELAKRMRELIENRLKVQSAQDYLRVNDEISPEFQAGRLAAILKRRLRFV